MIISINPATLEKNGEVREFTLEEIDRCFEKARTAQNQWRKIPLKERARRVARVNEYLVAHIDEISMLISKEVGKPEHRL